ncbi:MAG: DMT family transporter [Lachnospiraceae bacterium]
MYYFLSLLSAALISIMIVINGTLTKSYDIFLAGVMIHLVGFAALTLWMFLRKKRFFRPSLPWFLYTGGALGVITTFLSNITYGTIGVCAIVALGLLAQSVTSLIIDHFGFWGMPVKKMTGWKFGGLIFTLFGIIILLKGSTFSFFPVLFSLLIGITIIISRFSNAALAKKTSVFNSTWYNYVVGLTISFIIWISMLKTGYSSIPSHCAPSLWIYTGGLLGVAVILLSNLCTIKIPAFLMTLTLFIGQVFTGIFLDILLGQLPSMQYVLGGLITTAGLCFNLFLEKNHIKATCNDH